MIIVLVLVVSKKDNQYRMRTIALLLFMIPVAGLSRAQKVSFRQVYEQGKKEFKAQEAKNQNALQNYSEAVALLERAVKLSPLNAEAHYFLGYAYSRLNAKDGTDLVQMNLPVLLKCSHELQTCISLQPDYKGELLILGPYAKLTSEWGAMAMSYWYNHKPDSAKWAFGEGKRRGGFSDFFLAANRLVLDQCADRAMLISLGDMVTMPLWYLQINEGYRQDISVMDVSLLNSIWYPRYLLKNDIAAFDISAKDLDNIEYCNWGDTVVSIGGFTWRVQPSYQDQYLLRGDRVLLSMLKQNNFKRPVYFTAPFAKECYVGLEFYLQNMILVDRVRPKGPKLLPDEEFKTQVISALKLLDKANKHCAEEVTLIDNIRITILKRIRGAVEEDNKPYARELKGLLEEYADE